MEPKVKLVNISKSFQLYTKQSDKLLEILIPNRKKNHRNFNALMDVSFEVFEGEAIGIIGLNGSGKSTLSNILAEVIPPSSGELTIRGETSLIAITAGFNHQLTGIENIKLKCLMLGLKPKQIEKIIPDIIEFADIGHFIDQPIKNYSSGMRSRLGFAISVFTDPDILVVDEALSVGDNTFYRKCLDKIDEFKANGKTIFFISHSIDQMRSISDRVLWLHHGQMREFGDAKEVLNNYQKFIRWFNGLPAEEKQKYKQTKLEEQSQNYQQSLKKRFQKKSKSKNKAFFIQLTAVFLFTLITAISLFIDFSPLAFFNHYKETNVESKGAMETMSKNTIVPKEVNKSGIIYDRTASVYADMELKEKIETVEFATSLQVIEQLNDIYKVQQNDLIGYIKTDQVMIQGENKEFVEMNIDALIPLYPDNFANSHQFFFSQLGRKYDDILSDLNGLTNQTDNTLSYLDYGLTYIFNDEGMAVSMVIENINTNDEVYDDIISNAKVSSKDKNLFLIEINEFTLLVDEDSNTIKIINEE